MAAVSISGTFQTFTILFCLLPRFGLSQNAQLPEEEKNTLREVAIELGKKDWDFSLNPCDGNSNWNTSKRDDMPVYQNNLICKCSFPDGVCHVEKLYLKGQDLPRVLPRSLAKLQYLNTIDLNRNFLNGTIPQEWESIKLVYLILSANNLSGKLPVELYNLNHLKELRLSSNNFTGKIPSFQSWRSLQKLELQSGGLEGPIPSTISLLTNLTELRISTLNGEASEFPQLGNMTAMSRLMLSSCNIFGKFPKFLANMTKLQLLDLSFNKLEGLEGLLSLEVMYLIGNNLSGPIQDWIKNRGPKNQIDLSYNNFDMFHFSQYFVSHVYNLLIYQHHHLVSSGTTEQWTSILYNGERDLGPCLLPCSKDFKPVSSGRKKIFISSGVAVSALSIIIGVLCYLWWNKYVGDKISREKGWICVCVNNLMMHFDQNVTS